MIPPELRYKKNKDADVLERKVEFLAVKNVSMGSNPADYYCAMAEAEAA